MGEIRVGDEDQRRYQIVSEWLGGKIRQREAAEKLGLSVRQAKRIRRRVRRRGLRGVIHGNRGRKASNRTPEELRREVIEHYRRRYEGFNLTHFVELLARREKISIGRETARRILAGAGAWDRRRDAPAHRQRRPRRERPGELLQADASIHRWFHGREEYYALVGAVDDATGWVWARFEPQETTAGYFRLAWEIFALKGIPRAFYADQDSIFCVHDKKTREDQRVVGKVARTQFGRAMDELGVRMIVAYSPQAKGRIERVWGTFQDRLYHELKLERIATLEEANQYLRNRFLPRFNRRFMVAPPGKGTAFKTAPSDRTLERVLCHKEIRTLAGDHTFALGGRIYQVLPTPRCPGLRGRRVEVLALLNGKVEAYYQGHRLPVKLAPQRPARAFPSPLGGRERRKVI